MDASTCIILCFVIGLVSYILGRRGTHGSGLSRTDGNNGSARDLEQRAEADNRRLADEERGTADTVREAAGTIRDQAEDIGRAGENVKSAEDLIKKGKAILDSYRDTK